MALQFLAPDATEFVVGESVVLKGAEAHHAINVRRLALGEQVRLSNGQGLLANGVCAEIIGRELVIRIEEVSEVSLRRPRVILAQALAKGDRDELAIQAATELGVDEIWPWQAARSVSRWEGAKLKKGRERWQSIVREAAKQSHRAWIPEVSEVRTTKQLIEAAKTKQLLVLEPGAEFALSDLRDFEPDIDLVLIVGPEGGISDSELELFVAAGGRLCRMGENVLRTSTAGPVALTVLSVALSRI